MLLPEIALSSQWLERFAARFGVAPAVWHSDLRPRTRRDTWRAVAEAGAAVVVGARSALFLPFPDLGLIVVDEEHETSFKQEDGVGLQRARHGGGAGAALDGAGGTGLGHADRWKAGQCRGRPLRRAAPPARHGGARCRRSRRSTCAQAPPERGRLLSPPLMEAISETMARGEQAMLFLNRRGYAPLTLCRACGHGCNARTARPGWSSIASRRRLVCHHCGYSEPMPAGLPGLRRRHSWSPCGPGVERMPRRRRRCSRSARGAVHGERHADRPARCGRGGARDGRRARSILIGTQMVAKGQHFPHLTLVGVVDADLGLAGGDLRAAERTSSSCIRSPAAPGAAERPGRALLQTFTPGASGDAGAGPRRPRPGSSATEAESGRAGAAALWPPRRVDRQRRHRAGGRRCLARDVGRAAPRRDGITVLGPAPAPLAILRGRHRRRLLLKTRRDVAVQPILRDWLEKVRVPGTARVDVDVDPVSFL